MRPRLTPVPNLIGLELDGAAERLADQGLRQRHHAAPTAFRAVPAVRVLEQRPGPGSIAKRGGVVDLVLSRGLRVSPVPDLLGSALQARR